MAQRRIISGIEGELENARGIGSGERGRDTVAKMVALWQQRSIIRKITGVTMAAISGISGQAAYVMAAYVAAAINQQQQKQQTTR